MKREYKIVVWVVIAVAGAIISHTNPLWLLAVVVLGKLAFRLALTVALAIALFVLFYALIIGALVWILIN